MSTGVRAARCLQSDQSWSRVCLNWSGQRPGFNNNCWMSLKTKHESGYICDRSQWLWGRKNVHHLTQLLEEFLRPHDDFKSIVSSDVALKLKNNIFCDTISWGLCAALEMSWIRNLPKYTHSWYIILYVCVMFFMLMIFRVQLLARTSAGVGTFPVIDASIF